MLGRAGMAAAPQMTPSAVQSTGVAAAGIATQAVVGSSPLPSVATSMGVLSSSVVVAKPVDSAYLWQMDIGGIEGWIKRTHSLFPRRPKARVDKAGNLLVDGDGKPLDNPLDPAAPKNKTAEDFQAEVRLRAQQKELQRKEVEEHVTKVAVANKLLTNLVASLLSASTSTTTPVTGGEDKCGILDPSFSRGTEVVRLPGEVISRLTLGGMINALAGKEGGIVDAENGRPLHSKLQDLITPETAAVVKTSRSGSPVPNAKQHVDLQSIVLPMAASLTVKELIAKTKVLHRAIGARVEIDMLNATPQRIVDMLCPDVSLAEIGSIRKRIYDTVVRGKGTNASVSAAALEAESDLPVASRTTMHDIDKWKKCPVCNNNDQSSFVLDKKNGDLICTNCGTVVTESLMHEGSQFRKFEGEADRNHHGDSPNPLYSNAHNMSTTLGGVGLPPASAGGGYGNGGKRNMETVLRNAHAYTEMNISQFGKEEKKTRIGYKDRQKRDAFIQMTHVGDALCLHEAVVQRAKELFAGFRDDRELVQQFKGVVAACLCEAFDQLSADGRQLLRIKTGELDDENEGDVAEEKTSNGRASRRKDLHSATFAGRGRLFAEQDDGPAPAESTDDPMETETSPMSEWEKKPASTWNLDDCRSWLLEASKSIARNWVAQQKEDEHSAAAAAKSGTAAADVPKGTLDELEGRLVEHTLTLCDMLETEMKAKGAASAKKKTVTPRVKEMGRLGIRWQHSHERGSGGKGGVGNSGRSTVGIKPGENSERSAGQVLILKTGKKIGAAIKDLVAGEAIHRELRGMLGRQDARKRKERSDDHASQRFRQMKRKPWLQAKLTPDEAH